MSDPWADVPNVVRARLRARARSHLQEMGLTEADALADGVPLETLGCVQRPHETLPYEVERIKALGKRVWREHGWDKPPRRD